MSTPFSIFKKTLLASSISAASFSSLNAIAQNENLEEEVVVRGIKTSLQRSLDIKRESKQIVEAITADDLGKMPDQNVAESLQRLPGIQIDRRDGEGTKVRIRGLDQNVTLLNGATFTSGLEYFQLGEWKQEFNNSLEGVPSELLGGVEVYKTPVASMIEGGIGGTINLKTRSALSLSEALVAANIKVDQGLDSEDPKPSGFFVLGNTWGNFGAIASMSFSQKTVHTDYMQNFSRENTSVLCTEGGSYVEAESMCVADPDADNLTQQGQSYLAPGMWYVMDTEQERERIGGSVDLEWQPTDNLVLGLDWFHNEIQIENTQYTVKHPMATDGAAGVNESLPYSIDSSHPVGVLEYGTINTPAAETNAAGEVTDAMADNFALTMDLDLDDFRISAALNASTSDLEQRAGYADNRFSEYTMRAYVGADNSSTGWNGVAVNPSPSGDASRQYEYRAGGQPRLEYSDLDWLSNPDYHTYKSHWALGSDVEKDAFSFRVDLENDIELLGVATTLKYGLRFAEDEVDFKEQRFLTDFSRTEGAQSPNIFDSSGNISSPSNFSPSTPPDASNAGVREAVYYDLCGNGGIPDGMACDIDGDGLDDNQPFGPWGYFLDAAIGLKAFDLQTSNGTPMAVALYGDDVSDSGRWDRSPGYLPWQTFTPQTTAAINANGAGASGDASRYVRLNDFFPSGGYANNGVVVQDASKIVDDVEAWIDSIAPNSPVALFEVPLESWNVKESTSAAYLEADFEGSDVPYSLNVGVRVVNTEVDVTSAETSPESAIWSIATDGWNSQGVLLTWDTVTKTKSYWDILPSLNFSLDTSESTKIRFSAAKVLARPDLQVLGKGFQKNFTRVDDPYTYFQFTGGSSGNPGLDPFRATQADITFEYYFGELGFLSGGVFTKSVESFIASEQVLVFGEDEGPGGGRFGRVDTNVNGAGGSVSGYELAFSNAWENGLGVSANYTYSANSADISTSLNEDLGLPGVSENSFNVMGFYENDIISGRIAYTWRDEFLSPDRSAFGVAGLEEGAAEFFEAYGQWDANVTWDVLENLSLTAEAINITGEDQNSYLAYKNNPMTYASQEPRVVLGVLFRL